MSLQAPSLYYYTDPTARSLARSSRLLTNGYLKISMLERTAQNIDPTDFGRRWTGSIALRIKCRLSYFNISVNSLVGIWQNTSIPASMTLTSTTLFVLQNTPRNRFWNLMYIKPGKIAKRAVQVCYVQQVMVSPINISSILRSSIDYDTTTKVHIAITGKTTLW